MFHYWNGSNVVVIYILLRKVNAESDFSPCQPLNRVYVILWCTQLVTAADIGLLGACEKVMRIFRKIFFNHPMTGKCNFTELHPILGIFFSITSLLVMLSCSKKKIPKLLLFY